MKNRSTLVSIGFMKHAFPIFVFMLLSLQTYSNTFAQFIKEQSIAEKYSKYSAVIVFDSTFTTVQESGLSHVTKKTLYYVVKPEASKDFNTILLDYDPMSADIDIKQAYILRANGEQEELFSKDKVYDFAAPARAIYWGARQKMIEPGMLNVGDAVYVEYLRKGFTYALLDGNDDDNRFIPPMRGQYYDIVEFFNTYPTHARYYKVTLPASKILNYKTFNGKFVENITEADGFKTAEFSMSEILPLKREAYRVANVDIGPKVIVTTTQKWEEKSKWFYGVNEDFGSFKSTPEIDSKVAEILQGATSELDSIDRLNRWCADEIRYSGISMGKGEGYTLHTGDMTFTDRCGVCKDKAGMLITMLRAAGFNSYAAMTQAGSKIEDIPADQFNHSVTVVQLSDGNMMLLDPTWVPFVREMWSSREQQQNTLSGLPQGDDLRITPISAPENHYLKITNKATIDKIGTITGTIQLTAEGQSDAAVRGIFTRTYKALWDYNLKAQILRKYPLATITTASYSDPYKYYENPVNIEIQYSIPAFAAINKKTMIIEPLTTNGLFAYARFYESWTAQIQEREFDFAGGCSQQVIINEEITLPQNAKLKNHKKTNAISEGAYMSAGNSISVEKNTLKINTEEKFSQRIYPAEAWSDFIKLSELKKELQKPIVVEF